ncbi:MAG: SH3 domain-containing protein [Alphaproteobacteria bacterium]
MISPEHRQRPAGAPRRTGRRQPRRGPVAWLLIAALGFLAQAPSAGNTGAADDALGPSGLSLPRYVSLRADEVNLRTGPGIQYPIEWVYHRRHYPIEIIAEFDTWRRIRDPEGTEGWVHQSMLSGRRFALVTAEQAVLRHRPEADAAPVARLERGVIAEIGDCRAAWCRIAVAGLRGWLMRQQIWGIYPGESPD